MRARLGCVTSYVLYVEYVTFCYGMCALFLLGNVTLYVTVHVTSTCLSSCVECVTLCTLRCVEYVTCFTWTTLRFIMVCARSLCFVTLCFTVHVRSTCLSSCVEYVTLCNVTNVKKVKKKPRVLHNINVSLCFISIHSIPKLRAVVALRHKSLACFSLLAAPSIYEGEARLGHDPQYTCDMYICTVIVEPTSVSM